MVSNKFSVFHVTDDASRVAGGVSAVVRQLSEKLVKSGVGAGVVYAIGGAGELPEGVDGYHYPPNFLGSGGGWFYNSRLREGMCELASFEGDADKVFHIHGCWSAPQYFASKAAFRKKIPFLFTAHGMLEPWLWNGQGVRKWVKKRAYWLAAGYPALKHASVVHAIKPSEKDNLAKLFPKSRIEVIQNAIDIAELSAVQRGDPEKRILFLGRIDPVKGVDVLLKSFASANIDREWRVDIVGPVWSEAYRAKLDLIISNLGLEGRVKFHGPLFGEEKAEILRSSWVLAAPSYSEVIGIVNLEAGANFLPSITTPQTGLFDWEVGGGVLANPKVEDFRVALERACSWSVGERNERGIASRKLVERRYSWEAVWPLWKEMYSSLLK